MEATAALRAANVQVAAGALNQPPAKSDEAFQLSVNTLGRLTTVDEFYNIVVRSRFIADSRRAATSARSSSSSSTIIWNSGGWDRPR